MFANPFERSCRVSWAQRTWATCSLLIVVVGVSSAPARASHCGASQVECSSNHSWSKPKTTAAIYSDPVSGIQEGGDLFWLRTCVATEIKTRKVSHICCRGNWSWFWVWKCKNPRNHFETKILGTKSWPQSTTKCAPGEPPTSWNRTTAFDWNSSTTCSLGESGPIAQLAADVWAATNWPEVMLDASSFANVYELMVPGYLSAANALITTGNNALVLEDEFGDPVDHTADLLLIDTGNGLADYANEMSLGVPSSGSGLLDAAVAMDTLANLPEMNDPEDAVYLVVNPIMEQAADALLQAHQQIQLGLSTADDHRQLLNHMEDFTDAMALYAEKFAVTDALADCDGNGIDDFIEIAEGSAEDLNEDGIIDSCAGSIGACSGVPNCCFEVTQDDCINFQADFGGEYHGDGTSCELFIEPIPTISEWGLIVLALLVLTVGTVVLGRPRRPVRA